MSCGAFVSSLDRSDHVTQVVGPSSCEGMVERPTLAAVGKIIEADHRSIIARLLSGHAFALHCMRAGVRCAVSPQAAGFVSPAALAELALLEPVFTNAGYPAQLAEANDELPVSTLIVDLGEDDADRARFMAVSIMPFGDDQFASTTFTQLYVKLPFEFDSSQLGDLGHAIALINGAMAVGHFAVRGDELFYRYMLSTPSSTTADTDMFDDLIPMLVFHQEHFGDTLEGALDDEISLLILPKLLAVDAG